MMGDGYEIYTNTIVIPKFDENKELFLRWKNFKGSIRVRIFHEKDCWPNPTPETFLDKQIVWRIRGKGYHDKSEGIFGK